MYIEDSCCESGITSGIEYVNTGIFELQGKVIQLLDNGCSEDQWSFFESHFGVYYHGVNFSEFYNPYSYQISENGDNLSLVVTNGIGDKAYYNNVLLTTTNYQEDMVTIYPNPFTTQLFIVTQEAIKQYKIYAISGQEVLYRTKNTSVIDVASLPSGIYFIELTTQKGRLIKKIIKN